MNQMRACGLGSPDRAKNWNCGSASTISTGLGGTSARSAFNGPLNRNSNVVRHQTQRNSGLAGSAATCSKTSFGICILVFKSLAIQRFLALPRYCGRYHESGGHLAIGAAESPRSE